jgi:hypothetical protein
MVKGSAEAKAHKPGKALLCPWESPKQTFMPQNPSFLSFCNW